MEGKKRAGEQREEILTVNCQLSTVNYQLTTNNYQLLTAMQNQDFCNRFNKKV